jgi:hypothetical protein
MEKAIANVFGVPEDIIPEFLEKMDFSEFIDEIDNPNYHAGDIDYFEEFVSQIPSPNFKIKNGPINTNTMNINQEQKNRAGSYGSIYFNKSNSKFVYKMTEPTTLSMKLTPNSGFDNIFYGLTVKKLLFEPLIHIILQEDLVAGPKICKLFKVYCQKKNGEYTFLYKLERLGPNVYDLLDSDAFKSLSQKEKNEVAIKIYGPIYKTLKYLRDTYDFEHGDLHPGNLVFVENPINSDGKLDKTKLSVKIIDFGLIKTGLNYGTYRFGGLAEEDEVVAQIKPFFTLIDEEEFGPKLTSESMGGLYNFQNYIIEESEKLKGGRRKQKTRKLQRNGRKKT